MKFHFIEKLALPVGNKRYVAALIKPFAAFRESFASSKCGYLCSKTHFLGEGDTKGKKFFYFSLQFSQRSAMIGV
ncbi:hypothetical protein CO692_05905 [Enterococcus sp. FDAARGOS_375]|nr:hypothetical protein CO692_05905 [Enterococcus sp. FDAARGOS_375]